MADSACLRRSFSNPSETSHDFSEGDPVRALGDSISFGRYMSENLAWEKWSTFSHNRYLEEAEKSSKPGSVAKMKAYFEAHYGKIGAKKQAALQQENDDSSFVESEVVSSSSLPAWNPETEAPSSYSTVNELRRSLSSPALNPETAIPSSYSTVDGFPTDGATNVESPLSIFVNSNDYSIQTKESQTEEASIVGLSLKIDYEACPPDSEVYQCEGVALNESITDNSVQIEVNPNSIQVHQCEGAVNISISENSAEMKINQSTDASDSGIILTTSETQKQEKAKLEPRSKQKPADSLLKSSKKSNVSRLSSSLARLATPVRSKKDICGTRTPCDHKSAKEYVEKKKPASKLVQMSINFSSDAKLMKKASPVSHKSGIGKAFTPLGKMIRQSVTYTPAPCTSRASVNSVSRHPSATPQSESRKSRTALEKSFIMNRSLNQKLQSPSGYMKSPARSSIMFAPFSFRTEERAVKRREFFERLEKEAENLKTLDKAKMKSRADFRKSTQSVNTSNAAVDIRREILSDKKKIPIALPHPPKCESKTSTNMARSKFYQPPRSVGSKPASANKSIPATVPTKKMKHENASPNILWQ